MTSSQLILKLVASADFLTAKDLSKGYPEIGVDKEILTELKKGLGLIDSEANDLDELEEDIKANVFSDDMPKSLQYKYCRQEHGYFTTLLLASLDNDEEMLKELNPQKSFAKDVMNCCLIIRKGGLNQNIDFELVERIIEAVFFYNLEDRLDYSKLTASDEMISMIISEMSKKRKWAQIAVDFTSKQILNNMNSIFNATLASRTKNLLIDPPKDLLEIPGFEMETFLEKITNLGFPWNLCTSRQVKYYKDEIKRFHRELGLVIGSPLFDGAVIKSLSALKAIKRIIKKDFDKIFCKDILEVIVIDSGSLEEDLEIARFLGISKKNYLFDQLHSGGILGCMSSRLHLYARYRKEYLGGVKKINKQLRDSDYQFLREVDVIE